MLGCFIFYGEYIERGFLNGPYLPIYGFGAILFLITFGDKKHSLIYIFVLGAILSTLLEYFTASILDVFFHKKLWDYSSFPLNFEGKISLFSSLAFGIGAIFTMKCIKPFSLWFRKVIPNFVFKFLSLSLFLLMFLDYLVSSLS